MSILDLTELIDSVGFPITVSIFLLWQFHLFRKDFMKEFKEITKSLSELNRKVDKADIVLENHENRLKYLENNKRRK